jgi:5-methylcytosine-specific restriction endonuclease McrA
MRDLIVTCNLLRFRYIPNVIEGITIVCKKANKFCAELGEEPSKWSAKVSLQPPLWFEGQALIFRHAAEKAANGERAEAIRILQTIRSHEMYEWFDTHGQSSGWHRANKFKIPVLKVTPDQLDPCDSPKAYEKHVFNRDGYKCRYCGLKVIAKQVLIAFEKSVGASEFRNNGRNADQHGIVHAFKPVADHVFPHRLGGRTNLDNLVISCPACNYGKAHYTVQQLGIDDPRNREPEPTPDWDGLTSLIQGLKGNQLAAVTLTDGSDELPF